MQNYDEIIETIENLGDYYSTISGHNVAMGIHSDGDIWLSCNRTYGREYFESVREAERRLEILYDDYLLDTDTSNDSLD